MLYVIFSLLVVVVRANVNCPTTEDVNCGTLWKPDRCNEQHIAGYCPLMCKPECKGTIVKYTSTQGCLFHGVKKSAEECKKLGKDNDTCKSKGGWRLCIHCDKAIDARRICPQTCGLCE